MAWWPFGQSKKNDSKPAESGRASATSGETLDAQGTEAGGGDKSAQPANETADPVVIEHDSIGGTTGPFDGDSVRIEDFDFSDFSQVTLDLSSMRIPLPKKSQVQVEMGEAGPKMVHIVTPHGRATPVAFASPRTGGMWETSSEEIAEGMREEGMPVTFETGPWGREVVGQGNHGVIRIIGVEGPRWLYRLTLAAPSGKEDDLTALGHEIIARTFVYRGTEPILAGNSLPVVLPQQLATQVQEAVAQRDAQRQAQQSQQEGGSPLSGTPAALQEALQKLMEIQPKKQTDDPTNPEQKNL
ncbi:DUF3710 domain-containing protein [Corynebacterium mayonis]|uniref:DUF3710 domain-containing protein n=1 Tax=Corynebacterium mayonis TaxID=3062461 RepID=UPI0031404E94